MSYEENSIELENQGYTVIRKILSPFQCERYIFELDKQHEMYAEKYHSASNINQELANKTLEKTVYNLHNKSIIWMDLFDHTVVHDVIGPPLMKGSYQDSEPFYLNNISARTPLIGNRGQQLHVDSNLPGVNYPLIINALWYFEDSTAENGATILVPGTQNTMSFAETGKKYETEVVLEAKAGDLLIFNGNLWHGGGPCLIDKSRWALINGYARWFIKPSFDITRNTPKDIYEQLSERQKRLLGFDLNPPLDEFTRLRRRAADPEYESDYELPNSSKD